MAAGKCPAVDEVVRCEWLVVGSGLIVSDGQGLRRL